MSEDDQEKARNETPDERLRIDAGKIDLARLRLAAVDRAVFGTANRHADDDHERLLREAVAGLFRHG